MNDFHDELSTLADWLFKGWGTIGRVLVVGTLSYIGLLIILRTSGKRTLSKMNAFDMVVTVALGSTLSNIFMSRQTGLADGLTGLVTLALLQFVVAWLSIRWPGFKKLIKSEPTLLFFQGEFLERSMHGQRVVRDEVLTAIRQSGTDQLSEIQAVVLETDGTFTVVKTPDKSANSDGRSSLVNIEHERINQRKT